MKKLFILRRKTYESDEDKYVYLKVQCPNGIQITTPFKGEATRFEAGTEVVITEGWKIVWLPSRIEKLGNELIKYDK